MRPPALADRSSPAPPGETPDGGPAEPFLGGPEGPGFGAALARLLGRAKRLVRTWPRALLLVGLVLCAWPVMQTVPRTHPVRLTLARPADVTRVELVWIEPDGDRVLRHAAWGFAPGRAPTQLTSELSVSRGAYRVRLRVERGSEAKTAERTVSFEADEAEIVLPVE